MTSKTEIKNTFNEGWKLPFFTIWVGQAFSLLGSD